MKRNVTTLIYSKQCAEALKLSTVWREKSLEMQTLTTIEDHNKVKKQNLDFGMVKIGDSGEKSKFGVPPSIHFFLVNVFRH